MRFLALLLPFLAVSPAVAETGVSMLPGGGEHDDAIPRPAEVLGFEVGAQHARHDQLVSYFRALAEASDRVRLETIGRTHEGREQLLAVITLPENQDRMEDIRQRHLAVARGEREVGDGPVVLWQGYSIHGDESSGSNAAMLYAWHLASSNAPDVREALEQTVVLVDPSLNPDGMARFAAWATARRGETPVTDPAHREHNEAWPSGRGNHYWFDLNRDWLLLQHPASRHRVQVLNRWRPHVVTDHHEMGSQSTYFFQPGVPDRTHPLTSDRNQSLTGRIAGFHAERLDAAGRLYYTAEQYDDFYYGKGSTYPDITGGIGILFEQASTAGQAIETPYGVRRFSRSVQNQLYTSLSTLEAAVALGDELRDYQADFFRRARENADGAWVVGDAGNPGRMHAFLSVLAGHDIRFRPLEERIERDGQVFQPGAAWVVPEDQTQASLIRALFETRTSFPSHVFYDVSAWTLPLAFDLPYGRLSGTPDAGDWTDTAPEPEGEFRRSADAVAYVFDWGQDAAPPTLQALLADEVKVQVATEPLTVSGPESAVELGRGAIVVPMGIQSDRRDRIETVLSDAATGRGLVVQTARTGLTPSGVDLGSPSLAPVKPVKPLLVVGAGVNPYEAGEVWHLADRRLGLPLTQVERGRLSEVSLDDYTHVVLVGGRFEAWGEEQAARLHQWLAGGGVLITQQEAAKWSTDFRLQLLPPDRKAALAEAGGDFAAARAGQGDQGETVDSAERRDYADYRDDFAERLISGTIFAADADITHPLAFGVPDRNLPVFKNRHETLERSDNPYATVVAFDSEPLLGGYASPERLEEIAASPALMADRVGEGLLVRFAHEPLFRGVWRGTGRLMINALYFGRTVEPTELEPGR